MIVFFLIVALASVVIGHALKMPRLNPLTAFFVPWALVLVIASWPGVLGSPLSSETWQVIFLGTFGVVAGSLSGWVVSAKRSEFRSNASGVVLESLTDKSSQARLALWHRVLVVLLLLFGILQVYSAWPIISSLGGLDTIFSSGAVLGNQYKFEYQQLRIDTVNSGFDSGSALLGVLGYVLFIGHGALFTGAYMWRAGRRFEAVVPLVISGAYSVFTLQRTSFVMSVLLFLISLIYSGGEGKVSRQQRKSKNGLRQRVLMLLGGFVGAVVLLYPIQQRNSGSGNSTGALSLAQYLVASVAGLNARLGEDGSVAVPSAEASGEVAPYPGWGAYTFDGLFGLLKRAGMPVELAPHAFDYSNVDIFGQVFSTNTGSAFLDFYLDFGRIGVFVCSLILGALSSYFLLRYRRMGVSSLPFLAICIGSLAWSFFVNALLGDFRYLYLSVVMGYVLPRFVLTAGKTNSPTGRVRPEGVTRA